MKNKLSISLVIGGVVFWIAQTAYFGWNLRPESDLEMLADMLSMGAILIGFIIKPVSENYYITPKKMELNVNGKIKKLEK